MTQAKNLAEVPGIFDRAARRRARGKSAAGFAGFSFLHARIMDMLSDRIDDVAATFPLALACGIGALPFNARKAESIVRMDLSATHVAGASPEDLRIEADIESFPFNAESFDLIASLLELHAVNDLPGALIRIRRALRPGGLFLGALFGRGTLAELRESLAASEVSLRGNPSPRVFPFADAGQMAGLMQRAGFALPVVDSEVLTVTYETLPGLLRDLRGMGEGNILSARTRGLTGKNLFTQAQGIYRARFAQEDGRLPATFNVIFLSGWSS